MGNTNSGGRRRQGNRRTHAPPVPPPPPPPPHQLPNNYTFAAVTPYQYPNSNPNMNLNPAAGYYQYHPGYYPHPPPPPAAMSMPLPAPYDHHHPAANWAGRYGPVMHPHPPGPFMEHQKATTIKNDVNVKKESIRLELDEDHPGKYLVAFTFDATVAGSITVIYFAKEGADCNLTPTRESLLPPMTLHFEQGLGQKYRQPSGTGIDFSMFEESDLLKKGDVDIYPLAVKADAYPASEEEKDADGNPVPIITNSQITQAVFDKDKGEYIVKVLKQILWVKGMRYELQEIYGIGNSVEGDFDGNDPGKECVICLSEPRDTTVLPCRHMCMCSGCAKVLRFQTNRCPICRQPVERLLEIKVSNGDNEESNSS